MTERLCIAEREMVMGYIDELGKNAVAAKSSIANASTGEKNKILMENILLEQ